jgi:hypothetical protein
MQLVALVTEQQMAATQVQFLQHGRSVHCAIDSQPGQAKDSSAELKRRQDVSTQASKHTLSLQQGFVFLCTLVRLKR